MTAIRVQRASRFAVFLLATSLLAGCGGGSDDPGTTGPGGETQTASAVATPSSGTIARLTGTTSTTVVYAVTGGLTISSFGINRQYGGIAVTQTTTQTVGSTTTKAFTISADATVPTGTHEVRFTMPVSNYTGNGIVPVAVAIFQLTVTP